MRRTSAAREGMTLIEIMVVVVIIALAASGIGYSVGALARTSLRSGATRVAAAVRFSYNRAVTHGETVRIAFEVPANTFSIESAHGSVTLAQPRDDSQHGGGEDDDARAGSVDPWAAARARLETPDAPTLGASPFSALTSSSGKVIARYKDVELGRHIHIVKLIVPHEPTPRDQGKGAIHFFPSGYTEHAIIQLSDGTDGVFTVEVKPLTGRCVIHEGAYEPDEFLDNPEDPGVSEVDE